LIFLYRKKVESVTQLTLHT